MVSAEVLAEPYLIFGGQQEEKDPRLGLEYFGPYYSSDESAPSPSVVRVGIVGTGQNVSQCRRMIEAFGDEIPSQNSNKWLEPDFPGFQVDSKIACRFETSDRWNSKIAQSELRPLEGIANVNERIAECANLYVSKIQQIAMEDDTPHVIVCTLSEWVEKYCGRSEHTRGASRPERTEAEIQRSLNKSLAQYGVVDEPEEREKDYDLHNAMKGKALEYEIPLQILKQSTVEGFMKQLEGKELGPKISLEAPAKIAWNLSTALYYKANGRPWRLAKLTPDTCYIGIRFFENKRAPPDKNLQFSMAQVFTHSLEGFVLRGTNVTVDDKAKEAHMSEEQAENLAERAIARYEEKTESPPSRVVVHKSSGFSTEEKRGVLNAIGDTPRDLVAIHDRHGSRFMRMGDYPPLRGTLIRLSEDKCLLYTKGYTPRLRTYPGHRVPRPLMLEHDCDEELERVCDEILGLTKLDWNSTAFAKKYPITLQFAKNVGKILSELRDDDNLRGHYRHYM